jgi:hypothetical protein
MRTQGHAVILFSIDVLVLKLLKLSRGERINPIAGGFLTRRCDG